MAIRNTEPVSALSPYRILADTPSTPTLPPSPFSSTNIFFPFLIYKYILLDHDYSLPSSHAISTRQDDLVRTVEEKTERIKTLASKVQALTKRKATLEKNVNSLKGTV